MAQLLNIDMPDLPEGYVPVEAVAVIKCLDDQGNLTIAVRTSSGVMAWEAVGMLISASDMARADLQTDLILGEERDEGDGDATG